MYPGHRRQRHVIASMATDGIDGNSMMAGAIADGCSLNRAQKKHFTPDRFLQDNDASTFFSALVIIHKDWCHGDECNGHPDHITMIPKRLFFQGTNNKPFKGEVDNKLG